MGLTILDAGVLIGFLDPHDPHHQPARTVLSTHLDARHTLTIPASAYAEVLVGPTRRGPDATNTVQRLIQRLPITVLPLDQPTAITAAALRAQHPRRLKLPDALVIATAHTHHADTLITTDQRWPPTTITPPTQLHTLTPQ